MNQSPPEYYRQMAGLPRLLLLMFLLLMFLLLAHPGQADSFRFSKGDLPIILVAPHAGSQVLQSGQPRRKDDSSDPHFSTSKDLVTKKLTYQLASHFPVGSQPSTLVSEIHRKYADLNRPLKLGTHDEAAREFHQAFHQQLSSEVFRLKSEFGWVLLIDIHGQGSIPIDLIVGTRRGKTISNWSESLLWGSNGILSALEEKNFSTAPTAPDAKFRYGGGFIVRHYGKDPLVEAWQIEHSKSLRFDRERNLRYTTYLAQRLKRALLLKDDKAAWFFISK